LGHLHLTICLQWNRISIQINKRLANDGNDYQDNTNNNNKRARTPKVDLRFLLASRMKKKVFKKSLFFYYSFENLGDAGAIIGRQGKNIQMLRSKYKTIIQVPVKDVI